MQNARQELIQALTAADKLRTTDIIAFNIEIRDWHDKVIHSCKGTSLTADDLDAIDVLYDSGYGSQRLFGLVLFNDNTWLSREEYDGSEWWIHNIPPTVEYILGGGI